LNGQQQAAVVPQPPTPAITAYDPTAYHVPRYEHIRRPTFSDLWVAALRWDMLVARYHLSYAFAGSFAAKIRADVGEDFPVLEIEIVVEHASYANNGEALARILRENPNDVAVTETNQHIILTAAGGFQGVTFICSELGTNDYPQSFVPRTVGGPEYTFYKMPLSFDGIERWVPIIHSRLLLQQRLFRFDPAAVDDEKNVRDVEEIRIFLHSSAVQDKTLPFPDQVGHELFPIVLTLIKYTQDRFVGTERGDLDKWRYLGLDVPDEYISYACHERNNRY
jgi:hypothetical protein